MDYLKPNYLKKKTSAVPAGYKFRKHYQIIAFATNGINPRVFNKLRISPPLPANYKSACEIVHALRLYI